MYTSVAPARALGTLDDAVAAVGLAETGAVDPVAVCVDC
jgi:hypothetical protein